MQSLTVNVPGAPYPIHVGAGALTAHLPDMVAPLGRELVVVVTNETLERLYPNRLAEILGGMPLRVESCVLPDGEPHKTLETMGVIYDRLMALEANRNTLLIAFGGGVVGDMAGFAAATFMRGLSVLQVPTTLLAQVDSSVGGKTAVNHREGKNAVGAFKQPQGVVIDLEFLNTLPERELRAGLFELIKHGIIRDPALFDFLEANQERFQTMDWNFWEEAVARSCAVKARVVEEDPTEKGIRAVLNFGHSLGHLIETHTRYETCLHGEAVGVGMLFAAYLSREWGLIPAEVFQRIRSVLEPLMRPIATPPLEPSTFDNLLMHDKKAAQRSLRFIVLHGLGEAAIREGTTPGELWPLFQRFREEVPGVLRMGAE